VSLAVAPSPLAPFAAPASGLAAPVAAAAARDFTPPDASVAAATLAIVGSF
jgi:hypothetical protein